MAMAIAALARKRPSTIDGAEAWPFPIPASSRRWAGWWREGRQTLRGRLHGGRQNHAGAGAGEAARLARGGYRRVDRTARAPDGRRYLRAPRRAVFSRRRTARSCSTSCRPGTWSSPPAAARSSIRRTAPRSTATACRSGSTRRSSGSSPGCLPTAAARLRPTGSTSSGCIISGAPRISRRMSGSTPDGPASMRWSNRSSTGWKHSRALAKC